MQSPTTITSLTKTNIFRKGRTSVHSPISRGRVYIGMSGGVDSSVSAALLAKAGYDVTGVFIKVWQPDWIECNWREDRLDAMRVAAKLDIPFVTLDLEKEYKREVIDYMLREYALGRTPNPDVMCNREVKFGAFWRWAKKQGADYIATGHYAKITENKEYGIKNMEVSADKNKDQSYFLWTLNQDDLNHMLFPVGHKTKPEVRKLAKKFKLPTAEKKDSQGLCFVGKIDVKDFLSHFIESAPGDVLNEKGDTIGKHEGAAFLTIGERHGFTVTAKTPNDKPYYVVAKDMKLNTITVSDKTSAIDSTSISSKTTRLESVTWVGAIPKIKMKYKARSRYREPLQEIKLIEIKGGAAKVEFTLPQDSLTPGQSLVIYDGETCLGGGIISA